MTIPDSDIKILWGRAAGICSNPTCKRDLTVVLEHERNYNVGEMAHIIARSTDGPRGTTQAGPDTYANLILLCPTCHRHVDKAPTGQYPAEMLHEWKQQHEAEVRSVGKERKFEALSELKQYVAHLLSENKALWRNFGPESDPATKDPGSNLYVAWSLRKLDRIVPNNRRIVNLIEANSALLGAAELDSFLDFKMHAQAFETNQYERLDSYPAFPVRFEEAFRNG